MQGLIYSSLLLTSITTLILSIYSLNAPAWIRFDTPKGSPLQYSATYGLKSKCGRSNAVPEFVCRPFPDRSKDCNSRSSSNSFFDDHDNDQIIFFKDQASLPRNFSSSSISNDVQKHSNTQRPLIKDRPHHSEDNNHSSNLIRIVPMGGGSVEIRESDLIDELDGRERFGFCEKWNSAGFCGEISVVIGAISIFCIAIVILGNRHRQKHGWKLCAGLIGIHAISQMISWMLVLQVFNTDNRFYLGSKLSTSFYVSLSSSIIDLIALTGLVSAGLTGIVENDEDEDENDEDDQNYQPIP